ncbi:MAG: FHA domain-containing protein [candidate division KSB1 bacterium]|jgi:hypothetical protein|nr:FHA domain-containing protein [candidate division KSB1 bacterium]
MGLKDKAKEIWKRVSELDDDKGSSNGLSDDKNRIPYKDISKKLKEVMKQNVDVVGRKIIIPSYYAINFSEIDRQTRIEVEDVLCEELKEELYHEMRKINPEQNKRDLQIELKTDPDLDAGAFSIDFHVKSPETDAPVSDENAWGQPAAEENAMDYQATVVEQQVEDSADDAQTVVVPRAQDTVRYKILVDSGEDKKEIDVVKETISIGRGSKDDVKLSSPDFSISRSHAIISVRDGQYYITPSGINGTLLNGEELNLNEETAFSAEDEIRILNYTLVIIS